MAPWSGRDGAVSAPSTLFDRSYPIIDGTLAVRMDGMDETAGFRLVITPAPSSNDN